MKASIDADQDAGEDGALEIAESADDHDRECLHDDRRPGEGREHEHRPEQRPRHAGERRRDHDGERDQQARVDSHQAGGLAILRHRAQRLAEEGEAQKGVERRDRGGRHQHHDDALLREEDAADADRLASERRIELVGDRSEKSELPVLEQHRDADRRDQGPQLVAALAQRGEHRGVDERSEYRADAERHHDGQQVAGGVGQPERLGGEARRGEERRERAHRDEIGVREVDLVQHPVDQGEPQGHHHVQAAEVDRR